MNFYQRVRNLKEWKETKNNKNMKINFTQEHFNKMQALLLEMLMGNHTIETKFGQSLNAVELLHTTTISTLNSIRLNLKRQIQNLEEQDEWTQGTVHQQKLNDLKASAELVNLVIGYKRFLLEAEETKKRKAELQEKIAEMKEAQKTPEDRLKEAEEELASLEDPQF